jgi:hypothetical protein
MAQKTNSNMLFANFNQDFSYVVIYFRFRPLLEAFALFLLYLAELATIHFPFNVHFTAPLHFPIFTSLTPRI